MTVNVTWRHWLFLFLAVLFEVAGTSVMKISHSWQFAFGSELGLAIMWACIACSYFSLAKAITALPVGVAFALWDAAGLVLIVLFSVFILGEQLDYMKGLGLFCVLCGGYLVHRGTETHEEQ